MKSRNFKKKTSIITVFLLVFIFIFSINNVFADFISDAASWYSKGGNQSFDLSPLKSIVHMINVIGTGVISVVTVVLGIKYLIGSATGKSEVKQQLISLLVACILFFGWSNLSNLLIGGASFSKNTGYYSGISGATQLFVFSGVTTTEQFIGKIFSIVVFFGKIIAVIATMYLGAKYIFSGADAKSELKQKGPMYIIGILLIFSTFNVLSFLSDAINETLQVM